MKHYYKGDYPTPEEVMKNRLMDSCISCIQQLGMKKTSISDIAAQAGVARQTVYKHFHNKNEILSETFEREGLTFSEEVRHAIEHIDSEEEAFITSFLYVVENFAKNPILAQILEPRNTFLSEVGMKHHNFAEIGQIVFAHIFERNKRLQKDVEEISELWTRNAMSFIAMPSEKEKTPQELRGFVQRRLIPGLDLKRS